MSILLRQKWIRSPLTGHSIAVTVEPMRVLTHCDLRNLSYERCRTALWSFLAQNPYPIDSSAELSAASFSHAGPDVGVQAHLEG